MESCECGLLSHGSTHLRWPQAGALRLHLGLVRYSVPALICVSSDCLRCYSDKETYLNQRRSLTCFVGQPSRPILRAVAFLHQGDTVGERGFGRV